MSWTQPHLIVSGGALASTACAVPVWNTVFQQSWSGPHSHLTSTLLKTCGNTLTSSSVHMRSLLLVCMGLGSGWRWEWEIILKDVCRNLIEGMPRRIGARIKVKGAKLSSSKKTDSSCKMYIKPIAGTKVLYFGTTQGKISTLAIKNYHIFIFVS